MQMRGCRAFVFAGREFTRRRFHFEGILTAYAF
jgi:hypothetical protein